MLARLRNLWRTLRGRRQWEADLRSELHDHLEARAADLARNGLTPEQARRQARLELGSAEHYREEARAASGLRWFDEIRQDLHYAYRALRRTPSFVAVAVISLALGVGANTVVFSVVDSLILRPLPIAKPKEVWFLQPNFWTSFSYPNFRDVRDRTTSFEGITAYSMTAVGITGEGRADRVWGLLVAGNYFELLGVRPALGRFFTPAEDRDPGGAPFVVLAHSTWQRRFGGDSTLVGRTIPVNGRPYTVLGVAPPGFFGSEVILRAEVFIPMAMEAEVWGSDWLESRGIWNCFVVGRLKPTVSPDQARSELSALAAALGREFPTENRGLEIKLVRPGLFGDTARRPVEAFSIGVMIMAILVLLAACANLASLFAARVSDRAREFAVRMSIGAGRGRVVRQLVTETVALALLGGAVGWVVARGMLNRLSSWQPAGAGGPLQVDVRPDWRVFLVAFGAAIVAGLLSALAPARVAWRVDLAAVIKGAPTQGGRQHRARLRELLLVTQVTLAAVLVTACFVSVRGLQRSLQMPTGVHQEGVGVVGYDLTFTRRREAEQHVFQRRALDAVAALPGVAAAGFGSAVPLSLYQSHANVYRLDAADFRQKSALLVTEYTASPGYLDAVGTRLLEGRDFAWTDEPATPRVAVVNRRFVEVVLAPGAPVGQRFRLGPGDAFVEVIGVVEDGRYESLAESRRPAVFWAATQKRPERAVMLARGGGPADLLAAEMRRVVGDLDRSLPLSDVGPLSNLTDYALMPARVAAMALSAFGTLALMLALTGIHGMAAYAVSQRSKEIGIRMALGAAPWAIVRQLLGRIGGLVTAGSVAGIMIAVVLSKLVAGVVFQASPQEPIVLVGTVAAMALVAVVAAAVPARRAVTIEPLKAVRSD